MNCRENNLTVTAIKEGKATLTVILDSGESHNYSFTISANSYQMGFTIDSTPRIESWISGSTVKTEETAGLKEVGARQGYYRPLRPTKRPPPPIFFFMSKTENFTFFCTRRVFPKGILNNGIMATVTMTIHPYNTKLARFP